MLKTTVFGFALVGLFLSLSVVSYADSPVGCSQGADQASYWQTRTTWAPLARLFADRTASWISMTAPAVVRNSPACAALGVTQKQIVSKVFTNVKAGYVGVQALGDDHLVIRIKDSFDYPLYEFIAEPGDFTGSLISQVIRLTTGEFKLELENSDANGGASGVIGAVVDGSGNVLVHTSADWTGHVEGPDAR